MAFKHDLLNGPILSNMLYLMVPTLISGFFQQLYTMTDAIILGKYVGASSLAIANGSAIQIVGLFNNISAGLVSGSIITIAIYRGSQDYQKIVGSIKSALIITICYALLFTGICLGLAKLILLALQVPTDILNQTANYIRLYSLGFVFYCIFMMAIGILRSFGETKTASKLLIYSYLFNIVFDFIFVGLIPLKESGIAIAYIITQLLGTLLALKEVKDISNINYIKEKFDFKLALKILKIAIPICINNVCFSISCMLVQTKFNSLGTNVITSFAIYGKIEKVVWILLDSVNVSLITIMGQNFGAHKFDRVKKCLIYALTSAILLCLLCTFIFLSFDKTLVCLFTKDEIDIEITINMLKMVSWWFVTYPAIDAISSFLNCANKSTLASIIMIASIIGFRLLYLVTVLSSDFNYQQTIMIFPYSWAVASTVYLLCYFFVRKKIYNS